MKGIGIGQAGSVGEKEKMGNFFLISPYPNTCRLRGKGEGEKGKKKPLTFTL